MTLNNKTFYIYKHEKNTKLYKKKTEQNKEAKKMENRCASMVVVADSSIRLSSHP